MLHFLAPGGKVDKSLNAVYIIGFGVGVVFLIAVVALLLVKMNRMKRSQNRKERAGDHGKEEVIGVDNKGLQLSALS